jgi:dihydroorotase
MDTFEFITVDRAADNVVLAIELPRYSNFHAHLRTDMLMQAIAQQLMQYVKYLLIMPNDGHIDTVEKVWQRYRELSVLAGEIGCNPQLVMTIYFTGKLTPDMVERLAQLPFPVAVKYYPPVHGATTGAGYGVPLSENMVSLRAMEQNSIPLLGHFESVYDTQGRLLDPSERETHFMVHEFPWLRDTFPALHINIEHASTSDAVTRVKEDGSGLTTCGFTAHHTLLTRSFVKERSWAPHGHCRPILKEHDHMMTCREFMVSGDPRCHLGDDTASHRASNKQGTFEEAACGCFVPHSLAMYALAFELEDALDDRFVYFASFNGPDTWGLERPDTTDTVRLVRDTEHDIPDPTPIPGENDRVIPLGWTDSPEQDRLRLGYALAA